MSCIEKANGCGDGQNSPRSIGTDFDVCLPFGGRLYSVDGLISHAPGNAPADGVYTSITIRGGCIVGVGQADISTYTSTPCAPYPSACNSSSGSGSISISSAADNLSRLDNAGRLLTVLNLVAGDGISIDGLGTVTSPLIISADGGSSAAYENVFIQAGNAGLSVAGSGSRTDPFIISHTENLNTVVHASGFTFDRFGHLISYEEPSTYSTLTGITTGAGLTSTTDPNTGIASIDLAQPLHKSEGVYNLGGYIVSVDEYNRIYDITAIDQQNVVSTAAVHVAQNGGTFSFSFITGIESHFKISIEYASSGSTSGTTTTLAIDNNDISLYTVSSGLVAVPSRKFAAGSHTVSGTVPSNTTAFITIMLVNVV